MDSYLREREEPSYDEYVYCDECSEFVFEYCSIHGSLLVIPDDKVSSEGNQSAMPRAALTLPHTFLRLGPSIIPGAGIGVYSKMLLPRGVRFGPYIGVRRQEVRSEYCWQIFDRNHKRAYVVDAADAAQSNWLRYVNCARDWREQNLLAYQYQGKMYYRTIKTIPPFTELKVYYGTLYAHRLHIDLRKYFKEQFYDRVRSHYTDFAETNKDYEINSAAIDEIYELHSNNYLSATDETNAYMSYVTAMNEEDSNLDTTENYENVYTCEKCDKSFANYKYLKMHLARIHTGIGNFDCDQCDFKTNTIYNLRKHLLNHNRPKKYNCHKCQFKTNYEWRFSHHRPCNITEQKSKQTRSYYNLPRECVVCDFKTISRKTYMTHTLKHNGNVLQCATCVYTTYTKINILRHVRKHSH